MCFSVLLCYFFEIAQRLFCRTKIWVKYLRPSTLALENSFPRNALVEKVFCYLPPPIPEKKEGEPAAAAAAAAAEGGKKKIGKQECTGKFFFFFFLLLTLAPLCPPPPPTLCFRKQLHVL